MIRMILIQGLLLRQTCESAALARVPRRSPLQEDVVRWATHGSGSAIVVAVAGSGKTTTLVEAATSLPASSRVLVLAFNKDIEREISGRMAGRAPHVRVHTFHAYGNSILASHLRSLGHSQPRVNSKKRVDLLRTRLLPDRDAYLRWGSSVLQLTNFACAHGLLTPAGPEDTDDEFAALMRKYSVVAPTPPPLMPASKMLVRDLRHELQALGLPSAGKKAELQERLSGDEVERLRLRLLQWRSSEQLFELTRKLLRLGEVEARRTGNVDFSDMCYLPVCW
jgi:hypothetical protein